MDYYDVAAPVELNRDYVSLRMLQKNYVEKQYDSFIFGSSRSFPFLCGDWLTHIPGARPFHYPAASENIYGIAKKLSYLDAHGVRIRHALLEVSTGLAGAVPRYDATHRLPYDLTGETWLDFQSGILKAYFTDFYFLKYLDYKVTGSVNNYTRDVLGIQRGTVHIDPATNDFYFAAFDRELAESPDGYYKKHAADFPPREGNAPQCAEAVIHDAQRAVLRQIQEILQKQKTDYRILIAPDYRQVCLNHDDRRALDAIFGGRNVFDFTGVNEFTSDKTNFYDVGHLRPEVARRILAIMYGDVAGTESVVLDAPHDHALTGSGQRAH
jgi:hypothetical protein